jgi:phosphohistidine phosphatase SixA
MKTIEYLLMRHASYYDSANQYISYWGMVSLKESMDNLKEVISSKFPKKHIRIIHSELIRAKHTALLIKDIFYDLNITLVWDSRLNSDKLILGEEFLQEVLLQSERRNEVCLILTHHPDIKHFCKKELSNSEYVLMKFEIAEENVHEKDSVQNKDNDDPDDLPF